MPEKIFTQVTYRWFTGLTKTSVHIAVTGANTRLTGGRITLALTGRTPSSRLTAEIAGRTQHLVVTQLPEKIFAEVSDGRGTVAGLADACIHQAVSCTDTGLTGGWIALTLAGRTALTRLTAKVAVGARRALITHLPQEIVA